MQQKKTKSKIWSFKKCLKEANHSNDFLRTERLERGGYGALFQRDFFDFQT